MNVYVYDNLKRILSTDRGQELVLRIKEAYNELFEGKPIERATYADFMNIFEPNGDTRNFDIIDSTRRRRLFCLQILALDDDKYIGALEEMLAEFCEQYAWFSSYHGRDDRNQTFNYSQIDLDTANMSRMLSITYKIMNDKLRNDIKIRIRREIERRVIIPFENTPSYFGLDGVNLSNWIACQTLGTGFAYLYVFPERLPLVKKKLFDSLEAYLKGLADDGYSSEGYGYWYAGFGQMAMFLDAYKEETGEDVSDIINRPKVLDSFKFGRAAVLKYGFGLPFSDHQDGQLKDTTNGIYHITFKRIFGKSFKMYDRYDGTDLFVRNDNGELVANGIDRSDSGYHRILALETFDEAVDGGIVENGTFIFPKGGAYITNRDKYTFVAKAGHNDENHNHNDIGNFALYANGKRVFHDVRSHKYDGIYFDNRFRYTEEVFAAGSMGHSVPIVDGKYQMPGRDYKGVITDSSDDIFEVNISGAYDTDITTLKVRYELSEDTVKVKYTIDEPSEHTLKFRFISAYEPIKTDYGFEVCGIKLVSTQKLPSEAKSVDYLGHHVDVTVYTIDFDAGSVSNGEFAFEIKIV
ncbi:MAG: hypothetical protein E7633_10115 [Ruminococcaceae bacterium]|nr:hypothetical protein [Oscillospiraceae bacterium]